MTRCLHKGAILILEGDTDTRVYKRFIDETECMAVPANGKDNTIAVLDILKKDSFKGILAIVDADFWNIEKIKPDNVNILVTDTHDLETMILSNSMVMDKILSEFGSTNKMKNLPEPVISLVLDSALPIGLLRWLALPSRDNLPFIFRDLVFGNFIGETKLKINIDKLLEEIKKNSGNIEFVVKTIKSKIKSLKKENHPPWQVCSGHDMVEILAIGFRSVFGNKKAKTLSAEILEGMLRISYEYSHFQVTLLYVSIRNWEKANPSYRVLKSLEISSSTST
jgi:hypothetical protein